MPAIIQIPKRQYSALKKLSGLTEAQFADLVNGIDQIPPSFSLDAFSSRLAKKVGSISEEDIHAYVLMLCGLYPAKETRGKTADEIAADIKVTIESEMPPGFNSENISIIEARARKLLSIDKGIAITAKAADVATEHNNVFCGSKIYSDIRPIFSTTADAIVGAVVVHNLNISYHQGIDHREFYVALDGNELVELKETIERAEEKTRQMRAAILKAGIVDLEEEK
jgi:hypothetical protein